ncbi:hypothetical protein PAV_4c03720 [Paenibacillus alvei DSM 29]|nr:hypothetical protein PAV_4c03720 [Paenibacillus alvei DSM 29]
MVKAGQRITAYNRFIEIVIGCVLNLNNIYFADSINVFLIGGLDSQLISLI